MKPYPKYKPTNTEWIGEIPKHWEVKRLRFIATPVLGKMLNQANRGDDVLKPYLRAQNINWVSVKVEDVKEMWFSENELKKFRLKHNDLLVSEGGEVGRTCIWKSELEECYIQNSVHKISIETGEPAYFLHQFYCAGKTGFFNSIVNRISIGHLTGEKLQDICLVFPPLDEQTIIANFLDGKTKQIEESIKKKEQLIGLLQEERIAIITDAVTKGINAKAKMKPSGIEWLGDVPKHWEVKRLKYVISVQSGDGIKSDDIKLEGTYPVYGGNGITGYSEQFNSEEEEIIIGRVGAKCGNIHLASEKKWISDNALIAKTEANKKYLAILLKSMNLNSLANQNAQPLITGTMVKDKITAFPPPEEQTEIISYIETITAKIDNTISTLEKEIELLHEYRIALISEVVTGKVDVRTEKK